MLLAQLDIALPVAPLDGPHGPTPHAFTFRQPFPARGGRPLRTDDDWFCPA